MKNLIVIQQKTLTAAIISELEKTPGLTKGEDGSWYFDVYADYSDTIDAKTVAELLVNSDPQLALAVVLEEWYSESIDNTKQEIVAAVKYAVEKAGSPFEEGLDDDQESFLQDYLEENITTRLPMNHYLKQSFNVPIMLDTGDGNFDYTLNCHYPCYTGPGKGEDIDSKAGIVWLAKQQGYTKGQLLSVLNEAPAEEGKEKIESQFLDSVFSEEANLPSHMSTVTFMVRMQLKDLLEINRLLNIREAHGHSYNTESRPDTGYILLDKNTRCGLFDPWFGGGSLMEIKLEKGVKLPLTHVRCAQPDGVEKYGVDDVYGWIGSAWKESLLRIFTPPELKA